jgi:cytochrome b561
VPKLSRLGPYLIGMLWFQFFLGFGALIVTSTTADHPTRPLSDVIVTTLHQATGAAILALSVLITLWTYRMLSPSRNGKSVKPVGAS